MEFGKEAVAEHLVKNNMPRFKDWELDLSGAIDGMMDFNTKLDEIARDIRDKKDNAMAMEFVKVIGGMLVENGVSLKIEEYSNENIEMNMAKNKIEVKHNVRIDGLDFSEHDKPFKDEIKLLKERIEKMESEKKFLRMRCMEDATDAFDRGSYGALTIVGRRGALEAENKLLKQRIAELESEKTDLKHGLNEMEKIKSHWIDKAVEWQQKCEKLEGESTSELPFDALETANYIINATYERETSSFERVFAKVPDKVNDDRYTVDELEQIAEHLLVYCKHNKECEE